MTIDEAIRIIKIVLAIAEDFEITVQGEEFTEEKCKEAVEIVTKALEQEPCDAVSRKEVMNMLHNHAFDYATSTKILALLKTMCGEVDRMPSVTPQYTDAEIQKMQELEQAEIQKAYELGKADAEKVGQWIARGLVDSNGNRIYECSECHHSDTQAATMIVPYCWYCGAKMQEVKE